MIEYPKGATPLDPDETLGLIHRDVTTREELDQLEQGNIEMGLRWLNRSRTKDILDEKFVCELHRRLFGEVWDWAGTFRKTAKNIGVDAQQISVQLRLLLDDTKYWIVNNTYSAQETAVRFHHRLVYIHAFPNGNGRHARLMANTVLTRVLNKEPIDWAGGYDIQSMGPRRTEYIEALRAADKGDYLPLFRFAGI